MLSDPLQERGWSCGQMHGRDYTDQNTSSHMVFAVTSHGISGSENKVPSILAKSRIKPWKKPSTLLRYYLHWAHTWGHASQILLAFMISSHSSQQPGCATICLSTPTVETAISQVLERQETPKSSSNCHLDGKQLFLTALRPREAQYTCHPATRSTKPIRLGLECSLVALGFVASQMFTNRAQVKQHSSSWRSWASCHLFKWAQQETRQWR